MPFIHVRSPPFAGDFDVKTVIEGLTRELSERTDIALEHVTATWEFLLPGHDGVGGRAADHQLPDSHPILVDLLAPDSNSPATAEKMLKTAAASISRLAGIRENNIFINFRYARSGMVFDRGEVVRW